MVICLLQSLYPTHFPASARLVYAIPPDAPLNSKCPNIQTKRRQHLPLSAFPAGHEVVFQRADTLRVTSVVAGLTEPGNPRHPSGHQPGSLTPATSPAPYPLLPPSPINNQNSSIINLPQSLHPSPSFPPPAPDPKRKNRADFSARFDSFRSAQNGISPPLWRVTPPPQKKAKS